jgi:hypothetical protein
MTFSISKIISKNVLSAKEIFAINQEICRKFSPVVSKKSSDFATRITLTPTELFEISEEITRKFTLKRTSTIPNLLMIPIDPEHLYVSWNISRAQIPSAPKDISQEVVLRVYPIQDETTQTTKTWFDVDLNQENTRQKVMVPKEYHATNYTAAIGILDLDNHFTTLAQSKTIHSPSINKATYASDDRMMLPSRISQAFSSSRKDSRTKKMLPVKALSNQEK